MLGIAFESLKTNLKNLFKWVCLANWLSTIFCIFICSFPENHFFFSSNVTGFDFVTVCELILAISARLLIASSRIYLFTSRFN